MELRSLIENVVKNYKEAPKDESKIASYKKAFKTAMNDLVNLFVTGGKFDTRDLEEKKEKASAILSATKEQVDAARFNGLKKFLDKIYVELEGQQTITEASFEDIDIDDPSASDKIYERLAKKKSKSPSFAKTIVDLSDVIMDVYDMLDTGKTKLEIVEFLNTKKLSKADKEYVIKSMLKDASLTKHLTEDVELEDLLSEATEDLSETAEARLYALFLAESAGECSEVEEKGFAKEGKITKKGKKYVEKKLKALDEAETFKTKSYSVKKTGSWKFDPKAIKDKKVWDNASMSS